MLVLMAACCALFALALAQSFTSGVSSDGAANVLQAQAMLHGNPLLRGWWTSDVSFYTTELPEYVLVTAVRGLTPDVVHICGAISYTLTVLLAALLGYGAPGRARLAGAAIAAGVLLAPSLLGGTEVFLENPDHAGTAVPVLAVLLIADRMGGRAGMRWYLPAVCCVLLALALVGDELALVAALMPVAVVSAFRLLTRAGLDSAAGDRGRSGSVRSGWRSGDVALLGAVVAAAGLAWAGRLVLSSLGGFDQRPIPGRLLAPLDQLPAHARVLGPILALIFGANNPGISRRPITTTWHVELMAMADLHILGLVLAAAGLVAGIAAIAARRADRVTAMLVVAVLAVLGSGLFGRLLTSLSAAHEVAILAPLGAALAGRALPPLLPDRVWSARLSVPGRPRGLRVTALALAAWLAVGAAELCFGAAWPSAPPPEPSLAAWLVTHHERDGLAGYWQADIMTVATGGRVLVAPVTARAAGRPRWQPRRWEASADWYQPASHRATFVIAVAGSKVVRSGLTVAETRAWFGAPAGVYRVGGYVVMTYRYNLLTRLTGTGFPGPS